METKFNLRLFRKANGITQLDVAQYLGVTKQFISQVESDKVSLPTDQLKKILDNTEWSREKYRELVDTFDEIQRLREPRQAEKGNKKDLHKVPLLPIFAQAGHLTGWSEGVEEVKCERVISPVEGVDMAVRIYGESMYPDIPDGAVVFVKRVQAVVEWGRTYILDTVDGPLLKYLAPGRDEEHIKCISANEDPRFAPFEVLKENILGIYRVLFFMKMI